jgi:hypothetical protein
MTWKARTIAANILLEDGKRPGGRGRLTDEIIGR